MSANRFPKFPYLPAELRRMIWSFCIPGRRVYEMHTVVGDHHNNILSGADDEQGGLYSSPSGRFAIISHVCREAREVALESHVYITGKEGRLDDDGVSRPEWTAWNESLPVRLRKGFDVVHLHWNRSYDHPIYLPVLPNPLPYFQWLANQAAAASVSAELLHGFHNDSAMSSTIAPEDTKYFSPHNLYYVVLTIVEMHMTYWEAAHAGVFGRLGEEPVQLVDPRDTTAVARFRHVWRRHRLSSEEPHIADFFSRAVDSAEAYCTRVEQWRQELEKWWIWCKCEELRVPDETLGNLASCSQTTGAFLHCPLPLPLPYRSGLPRSLDLPSAQQRAPVGAGTAGGHASL